MAIDVKILPNLEDLTRAVETYAQRIILVLLVLIFLVIMYQVLTYILKRKLTTYATNERQKANVRVFLRIWRYTLFFVGILIIIFTFTQSLTALGLSAGFLGAALGWALQSPITGIAAWLMVMIKKPFVPGDRVIIDNVEGDVYDITLTHVYLEEFGGTTTGEDRSGRFIMIPTSTLFTSKIINSTLKDDFVLKEVLVAVTYESNLERASEILTKAAIRHTGDAIKAKKTKPFVRMEFKDSWVELRLKFTVHVREASAASTAITQDIHSQVRKAKDVEIAYPHLHLVTQGKTGAPARKP